MGGVVGLLDGWGCSSKPHGITGRLESSAQIRNKWGGKCNHTSIAAHFDMAEDCVLWQHLTVTLQSEAHTRICLYFNHKVRYGCVCRYVYYEESVDSLTYLYHDALN
jgi:hypothetical protein